MKKVLVCGAGGFIGNHLVTRLKKEGYWVRGVDIKYPEYSKTLADEFVIGDLKDKNICLAVLDQAFDRVYQLAADMGGAGFIFTGENDASIMHNSALINLNIAEQSAKMGVKTLFYSSSACIYPERNQLDPKKPVCSENSAYPAAPDSEYGWEKIFSERVYLAYAKNHGLNVKIARFHNIFGPQGTWVGGREKAPAAMCRKVAETPDNGTIEMWGDGKQTRSFLYIDECLVGVERLMKSDFMGPVNIGSDEMISLNDLAKMTMNIAGKRLKIKHIPGPLGVRGRNSDNRLIKKELKWSPSAPLRDGMEKTYKWISDQVEKRKGAVVAVSGGFDPIHIGHVRMFQEAKKLGGKLVVILNNDNWVNKKKGVVFMKEKERMELIKSFRMVDEVILTDHPNDPVDMSVSSTLKKLKPDVFANGGDRTENNIPEIAVCENINCKVVFSVGEGGKVQSSSWLLNDYVKNVSKK